ncbi:hypothetical protein AGR9A_Lc10070 [Agrobacterium salinitolerans str. Hayward 0363]|nr:hypothetical protein AGR9A_Lc10070 [Agrobacterium salinitolerans str. Hayward 0363]
MLVLKHVPLSTPAPVGLGGLAYEYPCGYRRRGGSCFRYH